MTKSEAIAIFGSTQIDVARALGLTPSRISQFPDELDQATTDRIVGAAVRLGVAIPAHILVNIRPSSNTST